MLRRRPVPAWIRERPIAHRGLHDAARPENSLAAFEAAAAAGYPIELDVHATADGEVVVFHDEDLLRMTGVAGPVAERSLSQLQALRLLDTAEAIPSLRDVLELVDGRVPVVVELKGRGRPGPLERQTRRILADHRGEASVQSFNPRSLVWFRRHAPQLPRGMLASDFSDEDLPRYQRVLLRRLALAPLVGPSYVGYALPCLPYWAPTALRRLGVPLVAWTIRSEADAARARTLADNMIFEHIRP